MTMTTCYKFQPNLERETLMKTIRFFTLLVVSFVAIGALTLTLTGCGESAHAADAPWLHFSTPDEDTHGFTIQEEIHNLTADGCCGNFRQNVDRGTQFNQTYSIAQKYGMHHIDQLTLSYRCWACNTTLPVFVDQDGAPLLVPLILQNGKSEVIIGHLTVPVNRDVTEVRLNVTSTGAHQLELLLRGETIRH